jgi:Mrp family chromosome partitioning ATPase
MSATDQAFIRAYDPDLPALAKQVSPARESIASAQRGANAPKAALMTTANQPMQGGVSSQDAAQVSSIHVGIEHFVPPPHAKFGSVLTTSMSAATATQTNSTSLTSPHLKFGQTAKAALSSFRSKPHADSADVELTKPALEVDAVRWPALCDAIRSRLAARFESFAEQLAGAESPRQIIAITGIDRGEGRSTLALCLARQLSAANRSVVLVDADFSNPGLIQQLSVRVDRGWEAVLRGEKALWDVMIDSIADRVAFVPLTPEVVVDGVPAAQQLANTFAELADHFEFVLIDAGPLGGESATSQWLLDSAAGVHGVILAHDVRRQSASRIAAVCLQLAEAKHRQLGIAEMFTEEQAAGGRRQAADSV